MLSQVVSGYPSDVTDEEWAFVLPYLLLCREDSPQRRPDLRRAFKGVRYAARIGGQWRYLPHEYGPWWVVYQQMRRWLDAGVFEALVSDVQLILREWAGRKGQPTAVCLDTAQWTSLATLIGARLGVSIASACVAEILVPGVCCVPLSSQRCTSVELAFREDSGHHSVNELVQHAKDLQHSQRHE